jgi:type III secretory pathway component EscT
VEKNTDDKKFQISNAFSLKFSNISFCRKVIEFYARFQKVIESFMFLSSLYLRLLKRKAKKKTLNVFSLYRILTSIVFALACVEFNNFQNRISVNIKRRLHHHAKKLISFKGIPFISFSVRAALCLWNY